jgi:predicted  nucleic acid-binding Zn-ribbon protein
VSELTVASSNTPLWRQVVDAVDRRITPPAEQAVQTQLFADAVAIAVQAQRRIQREAERHSRRVLHLVNIPTATDVRRVADQLAALRRQIRMLEHQLEDAEDRQQGNRDQRRRPVSSRAPRNTSQAPRSK